MRRIHMIPFVPAAGGGGGGGILWVFDEKNQAVSPVPPTTLPDPPAQAHTDLLALLTVSGEEDFESFNIDDLIDSDVTTFTANGITATVTSRATNPDEDATGFGLAGSIKKAPDAGRYNTSPFGGGAEKFWQFNTAPFPTGGRDIYVTLTFDTPIAGLWFFATDTGDFDATLEVTFYKTGGGTDVYVPDAPAGASDGALNFFGIVDDRGTTTYDAVEFRRTNNSDVIGIDGLGFITAAQIA